MDYYLESLSLANSATDIASKSKNKREYYKKLSEAGLTFGSSGLDQKTADTIWDKIKNIASDARE